MGVPLVRRDGSPFRVGATLAWAFSWGIGVGVGVALGAWLTVVGQAGAPGVEALEPGADLLLLPVMAFAAVSAVHLVFQVAVAALRGRRRS